jgi:hypothetical protein
MVEIALGRGEDSSGTIEMAAVGAWTECAGVTFCAWAGVAIRKTDTPDQATLEYNIR